MSGGLLCLLRGRLVLRGGRVCSGLVVAVLGHRSDIRPRVMHRLWERMGLEV